MISRVTACALALALAGCGGERPAAPPSTAPAPPLAAPAAPKHAEDPAPAPPRQPVVLALVVDQLSAWVAEERVPQLAPDGFFARLVREGTYVHAMRYPYAITDTAPGHASLHTGKVPAETHIMVNEVPDEKTGKRTSFFLDPKTKLVTPEGVSDAMGSSAARLAAPTVADRLRDARPNAKIVSVSLKDRASLLPAGKKPTHAFWFDAAADTFVTSTAVEATFPAWAAPVSDHRAVARARAAAWDPLDAAWLAERAGKDDAPGEGDLEGFGTTFPHVAKNAKAFRALPASDQMILDLAYAAVDNTWDPNEPLLVLVSLTASDVVGHTFGPMSWEAWDHLRRLDVALERFFVKLEGRVGPVKVLLSGDHGNVAKPESRKPMPASCKDGSGPSDAFDRPFCIPGGRLEPNTIRKELRAEATKTVGPGEWIVGVADGYVHLTKAARALTGKLRENLDKMVRRVLLEKHGSDIEAILDVRDLAKKCPAVRDGAKGIPDRARPGEDVLTLVCRSWTEGVEGVGDYFVVPKRGSFFDGEVVPEKGSSHGTPWLYDRTVPLFVRGGDAARGAAVTEPVDFTAYSAIEASFVGLDARGPAAILDALTAR